MKTINTHALLIGVGKRTTDVEEMAITASDAIKLGEELTNRCQIKNLKILRDAAANKENLLKQLDVLITATKDAKADMVIIYFSGHGYQVNNKYFLICHDTSNNEIDKTAIEGNQFLEKLQMINTEKLLILLDCCHAGGFSKSIDIPFNKDVFLNSKPNRIILTASHAEQVSFISKPVSLFTFALIEGLAGKYFKEADNAVTIFDLAMYVRERVFPLSKHRQQPQLNVIKGSLTSNFILAQYQDDYSYKRPFNDTFELIDREGKQLNINGAPEKDEQYRRTYEWIAYIKNSNVYINNNISGNQTYSFNNSFVQVTNHIYPEKKIEKFLGHIPFKPDLFLGREQDLDEIHKTLLSE